MASKHSRYITGRPVSTRGRWMLTGCLMLAAIVLGFGTSVALYQVNRETLRQSDILGYVLCGEGQHVDDVGAGGRARRMICRNAAGVEVSARNNFIAINMGLPFIALFAMPGLMLAWMVDWRETQR